MRLVRQGCASWLRFLALATLLFPLACDTASYTEQAALNAVQNQRSNQGRTLDQILRDLDSAMAAKGITLESRRWIGTKVDGANWTVYMKETINNTIIGRRVENEYVWNVNLKNGVVNPVNSLAQGTGVLLTSDKSRP